MKAAVLTPGGGTLKKSATRVARAIAIGLCLLGSVRVAQAQCQVDKVTASAGNAHVGDQYGWSVAVKGDYAVVGADVGDGGGSTPRANTGAAFLLRRDGLNWVEIQELVANDGLARFGDAFGASVAISENAELIVVGAPHARGNLGTAGAAYLFKRYQDSFPCAADADCVSVGLTSCTNNACDGLTWAVEVKLAANDPTGGDEFGISVDVSGDVVVVGAHMHKRGNNFPRGAAYVFRLYRNSFPCETAVDCEFAGFGPCMPGQFVCEGVGWGQEKKLIPFGTSAPLLFGNSVSIEEDRIVVGGRNLTGPGGAYIFERVDFVWSDVQKLTASDGLPSDGFGQAVDLHGETLVVTAADADTEAALTAGKAYVYRQVGGTFGGERILTASNGNNSDRFGRSASLHGNNLLIGAPGFGVGSAYLFSFDGTNWNEIEEIQAADREEGDRFGHAVSLSETYAMVGAHQVDDAGQNAGAAYLLAIGLGRDCNDNLLPDDCEVIDQTVADDNGNGSPDVCECQIAGDCTGGDACSVPFCDQDGLCDLSILAGFCRIRGVCFVDGATNPDNSCRMCDSMVDRLRFTPIGGSPPCEDDAVECTVDVCEFGDCVHLGMEDCACGDPADTECSLPDIFNAEGVCDANHLPAGTSCAYDGNPCTDDVCDGVGGCGVNRSAGQSCPDDGNPCTRNQCDGAGHCAASNLPSGVACPDESNPCSEGNLCDGAGKCGANDLPAGTPCTDDGITCTDDVCDGAGICEHLNDGAQVCAGTVLSHQKISATQGGFTGVVESADSFGNSIASLGDFDGDGVGDLAVGALGDDDGSGYGGAVWLQFLKADGSVKSHQKISATQGGFTGTLDVGDFFGTSVVSIGDHDGDGVGDLAVGATGDDDGGFNTNRGAVWLLFLNADGTVKSHQKISAIEGGFTGTLDKRAAFGSSVASLGDLDGDGVGDLAVGARGDSDGGFEVGAVWVLFLKTDGTVKSHQKINATEGGFVGALHPNDQFGRSTASLGDINGDGVNDLAVGESPFGQTLEELTVWVLFLNTDGTVKSHRKIGANQGGFTGTLSFSDGFGNSVAGLGDLDGDGTGDLAVAASGDDDGGSGRGAVWVLFLNTDGTVKLHQKISDAQGGFTGMLDNSDGFGTSMAPLGDLDGNGVGDLAVAASGDDDGGSGRGAIWVLFLDGAPGECFGAAAGTPCTGNGHPCRENICDGAGNCGVKLPVGSPCPDDGNPCTDDVCNQGGFCGVNNLPAGTVCLDDNPCADIVCDGVGGCAVNNLPKGAACPDDGSLCSTDLCDGAGTCEHIGDGTDSCAGRVKSQQEISEVEGGFTGSIDDFAEFGNAVVSLGDLDGDGVSDLAVGSVGSSNGSFPGAVWVLFLNTDGTVKSHQKIGVNEGGFTGVLNDEVAFGISLASLGDLDGDGVVDLAVGAMGDDGQGFFRGAVWVLFLNTDGTVKRHQKINEGEGGFTGRLGNFHAFGASLALLGDLDGDGVVDLAVGASGDLDGQRGGAVWVLFLNSDGTVKAHHRIKTNDFEFPNATSSTHGFGFALAFLGDIDGDGVGDLAVGTARELVWVLFLNNDGTVKSFRKISTTEGGFAGLVEWGDEFGTSLAPLGDIDDDGVGDLVVGAPCDNRSGSGVVWVLFLKPDGTVKKHQKISSTEGGFTDRQFGSGRLGSSLARMRDLNGDGVVDLAVGAIWAGAVWVLFLDGPPGECFEAIAGTPCTDDGHPCTDSVCDGAGHCGVNLPEGTVCPDNGSPCRDNVCNGVGGCGVNLPLGTACPDDGNPCTDNVCNWAGRCGDDLPLGTGCPEDGDLCTDDVCDGAGRCGVNNLIEGTVCPADENPCKENTCDGVGGCVVIDLPEGASCPDEGDACTDDFCDGAGTCEHFDDGISACPGKVKSHQKISATQGGFTGVLDRFDVFGISVAGLADLDGDGVGDLAVGASLDDDGGTDRGAVWILFLNTNGTVRSHQKISSTVGGFTGTVDDFDLFGVSVASMGDLDGDGVGDLAVGANLDDDGGQDRGAVWILFLNTDGTVKSHQKISVNQGGFIDALGDGDTFGRSVASLGDLDGDGAGDIAVGAVGDDDGGADRGAVWVLFLNVDGTVKSHQKISDTLGGFNGNLVNGDDFGVSLASLGDFDGDGVGDLAVGMTGGDDGGLNRGAVWLLFLNADGTVKAHQGISDTLGDFDGSLDNEDFFGSSVDSLGDLDGDGVADLAVGMNGDDDGGFRRGAVSLLFLNADGTVKAHRKISATAGEFAGPLDDADFFGSSMVSVGDLDGDGVGELAVGATGDDDGNIRRGAVWVLFLDGIPGECFESAAGAACGDPGESACDRADTCDGAGNCLTNTLEYGTSCDDLFFCNGSEVCVGGVCQSSGDPCGGELPPMCDEGIDVCFACETDEFCDDGLFCNGVEDCIEGACRSPGDPCTLTPDPNCDEELDRCFACQQDADCDDGSACTSNRCEQGFCLHPPAVKGTSCGDSSTSLCDSPDFCDGVGHCLVNHALDGTFCQDEFFCNGKESCSGGVCIISTDPCAGTASPICDEEVDTCLGCLADDDCDDELACTDDICFFGQCIYPWLAVGTPCDDQLFCNGIETCAQGVCHSSGDPCGGDLPPMCDEEIDICFACESDEFCADEMFCNGVEECFEGACRSPGNPCAATARPNCDEKQDSCYLCRQDAECDDGNLCTNNRCLQGFCVFTPAAKGTSCGDSSASPCDRPDFCDGLGGCLENLSPDGTLCQDQLFCNGKESCVGGVCIGASDPCLGSAFPICDEQTDVCVGCSSDDDCDDDLECTRDVCSLDQCIHPGVAVDTPCGDQRFTTCDRPDICDGLGSCIENNRPNGFGCNDSLFCTGEDTCRAGVCVHAGDLCAADGLFCDEFSDSCSATPPPTVIYSNTFGDELWRPPPTGIRVADDIVTNAVDDCPISDVTIRVNGGIPGGGGQFAVRTWLWDGCPSLPNSSIVAGTERVFDGLDDDEAIDHDLQLIRPGGAITLPPTFWIQVSFSTRRSGWVIGTPATTGYSGDQYFHPFTGCNTWFGGWPNFPHASGYTVVRAEEPCATLFPAYRAASPTAPAFMPPLGAVSRLADDLRLITDVCVLGGYELGIRGVAGQYEMSMDIRIQPEGSPIEGTEFVFEGNGGGSVEVARFTVPPEVEILIPADVWMTWQASKPSTGVLNVGRTQIGQSQPTFAGTFLPLPGWTRQLIISDRDAIFHITIYCRGEAPRGACCPAQEPDAATPIACKEDETALSCAAPDPRCGVIMDCPHARWSRDRCCGAACCVGGENNNQSCADNVDCPDGSCVASGSPPAFDPPCGTHACCQPGEGGKKCENLFFDECQLITAPTEDSRPCETDRDCPGSRLCEGNGFCEPKRARWSSGEFCGVSRFECPFFACFDGEGDCLAGSDEILCQFDSDCPGSRKCLVPPQGFNICEARRGCADIECCDSMCAAGGAGNFCCAVAWDSVCVNLATSGTAPVCPDVKPGNDFCFDSSRPSLGANQILLREDGNNPGFFRGFADSNNSRATLDEPFPEPGFCCHNDGVDQKALGTVWYWFEAPDTSARIDTCQSIGTSDTILQVFSVDHPDQGRCIDGSICSLAAQDCLDGASCLFDKQDACDTLDVIACNDDAQNCGDDDTLSSICLTGLTPGERYYVLLGSPTGLDVGSFSLRIRTPCTDSPPIENTCEGATSVIGDVQGFDLTDTSLDCPAAPCVPTMKNDYWKIYQASCTGKMTAHTCEGTVAASPATTMAVYQVPPGTIPEDACGDPSREVAFPDGLLVGCNDDAEVDKTCTLSGDACDSLNDCKGKRCTLNIAELCLTDADCADFGTCAGFAGAGTEGACTISGDACQSDNDCTAGRCADDDFTACDTTNNTCPFGLCDGVFGAFCSTDQNCIDSGFGGVCERWPCIAKETCEIAECVSSTCGRSAYVTAPVFQALHYLIRVGGEFGEEFTGILTVTCEEIDCNENGGPDPFDIVQGVSADCNNNLIPDECEILRGSVPGAETFCDVDCLDDCNENLKPDVCEAATITDCNGNDIADECEILRDSVLGLATFCDVDCLEDCNANGTMDVCEIDVSSDAAHCADGEACTIGGLPCADGSGCIGGAGAYHCFGAGCDPDTNNNGIPDECDFRPACDKLVAKEPPNCAIDARQPSTIDGLITQGWDTMDVTVSPEGCTLTKDDLSVISLPNGGAPSVNDVTVVGEIATITFDSIIPLRNWTCVSLTNDAAQQVCLGNLPGDVNSDGTSSPALDLSALIDCVNNRGDCAAWQEDIDRTGTAAGVLDIVRLIDLFNGVGAYESSAGASFDGLACPSE